MVKTLVDGAGIAKRKIVVAGEMLELGPNAARIHRETGEAIGRSRVDVLIGVRGLAKELVNGAVNAGLKAARFAVDSETAGELIVNEIAEGDIVLVIGSRGVKTEKVVEKLLKRFELEEKLGHGESGTR
jgi:UDP-N-acetylmuramoyl-tripeptide--D-alanyl-D-alanine ligase